MKVYVRKIDNQCVEKQVSVLKSIVDEFFGSNLYIEDDESVPGGKIYKFIGIDSPTKKEEYVRNFDELYKNHIETSTSLCYN